MRWIRPEEIDYLLMYGVVQLEKVSATEFFAFYNIMDFLVRDNAFFTPFYPADRALGNLCRGGELFQCSIFPPRFKIGRNAPPRDEIEKKAKEIAGVSFENMRKILEDANKMGAKREDWLEHISRAFTAYHYACEERLGRKI
jgi:hypothetical protein